MSAMLAARYEYGVGVRVANVEIPLVGPAEVLLEVETASICATDIRIVQGAHRKFGPGVVRTPGHEIAGRVIEVGRSVIGVPVGQRVFVAPNIGCGECMMCRRGKNNLCPNYEAFGITMDGGFARYMRVTAKAIEQGNLLPIGEDVDAAEIALAEPLACVLHGQDQVKVGAGDTVLVMGAGPIGLMHVMLAKARGAQRVLASDLAASRLATAVRMGADRAINPTAESLAAAVREETCGAGVDVVIVAAPSASAQQDSLSLAAPGGRINFFAGLAKESPFATLDSNLIHYGELLITGTSGCSTSDCRRAAELVLSRSIRLAPLITARFPLEDAEAAFAAAQSPANLKIVLDIHDAHRTL